MNEEIIIKKIIAENKYFDKILGQKIGNDFDNKFVVMVSKRFLSNKHFVYSLSNARGLELDFILYSDIFKLKLLQAILSATNYSKALDVKKSEEDYIKLILDETYKILLVVDFDNDIISGKFLSNKIISLSIFMLKLLKDKTYESIIDPIEKDVYKSEISDLIDSMISVFVLFNSKCYSQAMSVFRQALEIFITIKTLNMYKSSLQSFIEHQAITIDDALEHLSKHDLDKYIKDHNLTYNNYKSYLNYGWLDQIDVFQKRKEENPKIKYSIKTVSEISESIEFYDAMNFASNYVHSNFVFVNINWNIVISEVVDGCFQMIDWMIELIKNKDSLIVNGINYLNLYNIEKENILKIIKKDEYIFD